MTLMSGLGQPVRREVQQGRAQPAAPPPRVRAGGTGRLLRVLCACLPRKHPALLLREPAGSALGPSGLARSQQLSLRRSAP